MSSSTISCARMHDLSGLGRSVPLGAGEAGLQRVYASPRRHLTDASSIDEAPSRRPRLLSSRPERDDRVELLI
jgi:hypothetical protein